MLKAEIGLLLPHGESMCLLDAVDSWDDRTITCRTSSHRDHRNPLRAGGRLMITAGLEYAAQAMGVHVGLLNGGLRFVGSVRDVTFTINRLDDLTQDLTVTATRLLEGDSSYIYRFSVTHDGIALIEGRASIFIRAASS
jgi:predicted hotdog family 3-hydroxylacyl-ACP dehydratase